MAARLTCARSAVAWRAGATAHAESKQLHEHTDSLSLFHRTAPSRGCLPSSQNKKKQQPKANSQYRTRSSGVLLAFGMRTPHVRTWLDGLHDCCWCRCCCCCLPVQGLEKFGYILQLQLSLERTDSGWYVCLCSAASAGGLRALPHLSTANRQLRPVGGKNMTNSNGTVDFFINEREKERDRRKRDTGRQKK